jgi:hypothetical protein
VKVFRPGRCAICDKRRQHEVHELVRPVPVWRRLLGLAWPRWMWTSRRAHAFVDRDLRVQAVESRARTERRRRSLNRRRAS